MVILAKQFTNVAAFISAGDGGMKNAPAGNEIAVAICTRQMQWGFDSVRPIDNFVYWAKFLRTAARSERTQSSRSLT